jgi:hypothetical protein
MALDGATYLVIPAVLLPLGLLHARREVVLSPLVVKSTPQGCLRADGASPET